MKKCIFETGGNNVFDKKSKNELIAVYKISKNKYSVQYGAQWFENLDYHNAANELGFCIFHNLNCEGVL